MTPSSLRWGLTPRGGEDEEDKIQRERRRGGREQEREREGGVRDKEITCEHMALTAYEMYNYCLQLVKRSVVAKNSRQ